MKASDATIEGHATEGIRRLRINWVLPHANLRGGTRAVRQLAEALAARGHEVTIAFLAAPSGSESKWNPRSLLRRFRKRGRGVEAEASHLSGSDLNMICVRGDCVCEGDVPDADFTIGTWWKTMEWIRDWPPEKGICCHYIQDHVIHEDCAQRIRAIYRERRFKFAVSTWLIRVMREEYGQSGVLLIPNALDWKSYDSVARPQPEVPTVGIMYNRTRWKDVATGLNAIRLAQQRLPDLRVICFGQDTFAHNSLRPENFCFYHRPDQERIPSLYRQCSVWIIPSLTEGFCLPGLEAAASHCPVISTRCGGPEDYIRDGESGFIVNVGDSDAMASRILEVVGLPADKWSEMSSASYEIASKFRWERSAATLEAALYARLDETM